MAKLTDLQLVLLSTAAARADGSLLPPAASIAAQAGRIAQAIATLIKRGLAVEIGVTDAVLGYRVDGDLRFGATITAAGRDAIGARITQPEGDGTPTEDESDPASPETDLAATAPVGQTKAGTKQALLIDLLRRDAGASLDELAAATGWLPHTTRAALTGLRKKGHVLDKAKVDDITRYTLAVAA